MDDKMIRAAAKLLDLRPEILKAILQMAEMRGMIPGPAKPTREFASARARGQLAPEELRGFFAECARMILCREDRIRGDITPGQLRREMKRCLTPLIGSTHAHSYVSPSQPYIWQAIRDCNYELVEVGAVVLRRSSEDKPDGQQR